jgi:hypothetical protein
MKEAKIPHEKVRVKMKKWKKKQEKVLSNQMQQ